MLFRSQESIPSYRIDFGSADGWADTYIFIASNAELGRKNIPQLAFSRQAWQQAADSAAAASGALQALSSRFHHLFFKHGDLKRRFANMLAWGQHEHTLRTGQQTNCDVLQHIEQLQSAREIELRQKVEKLQGQLSDLNRQLKEATTAMQTATNERRTAFLNALEPGLKAVHES